MRRLTVLVVLAVFALLTVGCAPGEEPTAEPPGEGPPPEVPGDDDPPGVDDPDDPPTEDDPMPDDADPAPPELVGVLGGDAQLEGGCAWLDADGDRYEVQWPDGYQIEFDPLRLVGPDGGVAAEEGDTVTVRGRVAEDVMSICQVGPVYQADEVVS